MKRASVPILVRMRVLLAVVMVLGSVAGVHADGMTLGVHQHNGSLTSWGNSMPRCNKPVRSMAFLFEQDPTTHVLKLKESPGGPEWRIAMNGSSAAAGVHPRSDGDVLVGSRDIVAGSVRTVTTVIIFRSSVGNQQEIVVRTQGFELYTPTEGGHERCGPHWLETCTEWYSGPAMGP